MGRLFDFIKEKYQSVKQFEEVLKQDKNAMGKYNLYYKPGIDLEYIKDFITVVNNSVFNIRPDIYNDFINGNKDILGARNDIPLPEFNDNVNYEELLNRLEEKLSDNMIEYIISNFDKEIVKNRYSAPSHPFEKTVEKLKDDLNNLKADENELSIEEKNNIEKSLDYANNILIIKHDNGQLDKIIDTVSAAKDIDAKKSMPEFSQKTGIPLDDLVNKDRGNRVVRIDVILPDEFDKFKKATDQKMNFTDEFKNKIKALDNFIQSKSIIKNPKYGETGRKEYAFDDWFKKATDLKNEINNNASISIDDKQSKINSYKRINNLSNDLEKITNEYKDIIDNMKDNFDLNKIGLPNNIYSGREFLLNGDDLNSYIPNLPEIFDNENAAYGALLNGYSQLKGFCIENNITLDEFLDDPVKAYYKGCQNVVNEIDENVILKPNEASLGKRMARILIQPNNRYDVVNNFGYGHRALEFLTQAQDHNEFLNDNILISSIASKMVFNLDHSPETLFEAHYEENNNVKKIFAFGENNDNLLKLSNYYKDFEGENVNFDYDNQIKNMANVDPVKECNRVLEIIKDYLVERKYIYDHKDELYLNGGELNDSFEPDRIVIAAKQYFEEYVINNNINIQKISDKNDRKMVLDFINKPVEVLINKYPNEPNMFILENEENINSLNQKFAKGMREINDGNYENFIKEFTENNKKPDGYNTNKTIEDILRDNKGGRWENFFKTTSPEYLALTESIKAATNNGSPTRGDFEAVKFFAKKYLEYKLPPGSKENKLSKTSQSRVEFCRSILKTFNELKNEFDEIAVNKSIEEITGPNFSTMSPEEAENIKERIEEEEENAKNLDEDTISIDNEENLEENKENDINNHGEKVYKSNPNTFQNSLKNELNQEKDQKEIIEINDNQKENIDVTKDDL